MILLVVLRHACKKIVGLQARDYVANLIVFRCETLVEKITGNLAK